MVNYLLSLLDYLLEQSLSPRKSRVLKEKNINARDDLSHEVDSKLVIKDKDKVPALYLEDAIKDEPLLRENPRRFVLFPLEYPEIWAMYKRAEASFWTAEENNQYLQKDAQDWQSLTFDEKQFISTVLLFLAANDTIVNDNLVERLSQEVQIPEARCFYGFQIAMENIHKEMYSVLIDTFLSEYIEKSNLLQKLLALPSVQKKSKWSQKWIRNKSTTFGERVVALAALDGIFFTGSYAAITEFQKKNLLQGLTKSNELITRDKNLHCNFSILVFKYLVHKPSHYQIKQIIGDAAEIEKEFLTDDVSTNLIGINPDIMRQYVEFVADRLLVELGCPKIYNADNPFGHIKPENKLEILPQLTGEFQRSGIIIDKETFCLDADF